MEKIRREQAAKQGRSEEEWIKEFIAVSEKLGQPVEYYMNMNWLQYKEIRKGLEELEKDRERERKRQQGTLG